LNLRLWDAYSSYDFAAVHDGRTINESLPYGLPKGMEGFAFNTRRSIFADI
jgi:peptide/nickel transport system substrate-binding protein